MFIYIYIYTYIIYIHTYILVKGTNNNRKQGSTTSNCKNGNKKVIFKS